jgi:hypothetical protein
MSNTAAALVPTFVTVADAPGERVVTVPTAMVAALPAGPWLPVGPAGPTLPAGPGVPISTVIVEGAPSMVMSSELGMLGMG